MQYRFYVFHNYKAVQGHSDFVRRRCMDEQREQIEYAHFAGALLAQLADAGIVAHGATVQRRGIALEITTDATLFRIQLALSKIVIDRNAAVEGLFLDFIQLEEGERLP